MDEKKPSANFLWKDSLLISLIVLGISLLYTVLYNFTNPNEFQTSYLSSLAFTGGILIGLSFALSGISYYFNFLDQGLGYRKYLGLVGYGYALLYAVSLLFTDSKTYLTSLNWLFNPDAQLGLYAMTTFTLMALVSNTSAAQALGSKLWKLILRLGYLAYFGLILRAIYLDQQFWKEWWLSDNLLIPPRLLLTIFASLVILLRLSMIPHQFLKKQLK